MARDLAAINKVRVENGLEPLEKLPDEKPAGGNDSDPDKDKDNKNNSSGQGDTNGDQEKPPTDKATTDTIDDDVLLKELEKRGVKAASISDLLPKPDPVKEAERREAAKLSYALSKGSITKKDYDQYIKDTMSPQNVVYEQYYREQKQEDPNLTDEEIRTEFETRYNMDAEPGSRRFKRGVEEIGILADKILRSKWKNIYGIDQDFDQYETTEREKVELQNKINIQGPLYKNDVESILSVDLKKIPITLDDHEYVVDLPQEMIEDVRQLLFNQEFSLKKIKEGWTKEQLREIALATIRHKYFTQLTHSVAKQYLLKNQAGTRGIPPNDSNGKRNGKNLTEDQMTVLRENGIKVEDLPGGN